jgi:hypothetical protein
MNLNFYSPNNTNTLEGLQNALQEQMDKLDQIRNMGLTAKQNTPVSQPLQPQRYYVDCGMKEDWEEFLKINYNITEFQMFEDYKLFLQAKAELYEDNNKEKLQTMKDKILGPNKHNKHNNLPITQQVKVDSQGPTTNATNTSSNNNEYSNKNIRYTSENVSNNNENKGGKHAR